MFVCVLPCVVALCVTVLYCVGPLLALADDYVALGESNPVAVVLNVMHQEQTMMPENVSNWCPVCGKKCQCVYCYGLNM